MTPEELLSGIASVQSALKDGIETHVGYLLSLMLNPLKKDEGIHVVKHHYTADGITAELWYPYDKKTYVITMKEKKETPNG